MNRPFSSEYQRGPLQPVPPQRPPNQNPAASFEQLRQTMNSYMAMSNMRHNFPNLLPVSNPSKTVVMSVDMGIRKKTLKLTKIKEKEFYLCFSYDCSKEIEITVFLFVQEKADHLLITKELVPFDKKIKVQPQVRNLPAGKNMSFPQNVVIDMEQYPENLFFDKKEGYYPMVIKMRKIDEAPHILYNYIGFYTEENEVKTRFIRQKMELKGDGYEIGEIYGINQSNLTKEEDNAAEVGDTDKECIICFSDKIDTIIMPCRHMCLCITCATSLQKSQKQQNRKCPICRKNIDSFIRIQRVENVKEVKG